MHLSSNHSVQFDDNYLGYKWPVLMDKALDQVHAAPAQQFPVWPQKTRESHFPSYNKYLTYTCLLCDVRAAVATLDHLL